MNFESIAITDTETYLRQHENWVRFRAENVSHLDTDLDAEIVDILDDLNAIPGIATIFSCGGHDPEIDRTIPRYKRNPRNKFYIRFIVTSEGLGRLLEIYNAVIRLAKEDRDTQRLVGGDRPAQPGEYRINRRTGKDQWEWVVYNKEVLEVGFIRLTLVQQKLHIDEQDIETPGMMLQFHVPNNHLRYRAHSIVRDAIAER